MTRGGSGIAPATDKVKILDQIVRQNIMMADGCFNRQSLRGISWLGVGIDGLLYIEASSMYVSRK